MAERLEQNRHEILAARHELTGLVTTDIDAANEATALLGRALAEHRAVIEEQLFHIEHDLSRQASPSES